MNTTNMLSPTQLRIGLSVLGLSNTKTASELEMARNTFSNIVNHDIIDKPREPKISNLEKITQFVQKRVTAKGWEFKDGGIRPIPTSFHDDKLGGGE